VLGKLLHQIHQPVGKGIHDVIAKQSAPQKSVVIEMLAFYAIQNVMIVCHVAINRVIINKST
jgi:hypothetical protein